MAEPATAFAEQVPGGKAPTTGRGADTHALPTAAALFDFLVSLRVAGFAVEPRQIAAAQRLLAHARTPAGTTVEQLMFRLASVVATSPGEQEDFYRSFRAWQGVKVIGTVAPQLRADGAATEVIRRDPRRRIIAGGLAFLTALAVLITPWSRVYVPDEDALLQPRRELPLEPAQLAEPFPLPRESFEIMSDVVPAWYPAVQWLLTVAPAVVLLGWLFARWWRRHLWLTRGPVRSGSPVGAVRLPLDVGAALYAAPRLRAAARDLRRHRYRPTRTLDVVRTVEATASQAGYFSPVYALRPHLPEYVFLIEEASANDHVARLFDVAIDRLRHQGVEIQRLYYQTDPRVVHQGDRRRTPVSLADLAARTADHRLVVVATADGFFHPLTGEPEGWIERFASWSPRILLSTRPVQDWTTAELRLLEEGFSLATARVSGVGAAAEKIARSQDPDAEILVPAMPPRALLRHPPAMAGPPPLTIFRDIDAPWCPEMVALPAGVFVMGSPEGEVGRMEREGPQRPVTIRPFAIGAYEVPVDEWEAGVADGGCNVYRPGDAGWGRGRRPVINVSWDDAKAYVAWLSEKTGLAYRLPTEAEWEYAARAGTTMRYWWGEDIDASRVSYGDDVGKTTEVGSYPANPFGLHDMHGNVWEWVEDCWHDSYEGAPVDGSAWDEKDCSLRVLRGGSWNFDPRDIRSASRISSYRALRYVSFGFRVARTPFLPES